MTTLPCEIIEPSQRATASVIWLHGIGADGNDFVPVVPHLKLPETLNVRFVFPHAPIRPITCNGGYPMRAWYDILELTETRKINEADLHTSVTQIEELIHKENNQGIPTEKIVLTGFSQGGAVAYHTALHYPEKLAGLLALSTYLGISKNLEDTIHPANKDLPIKVAHGKQDDMVTERAAKLAYDRLKNLGYNISWHSYAMAHELCLSEIRDIGRWLTAMLE